MAPVGSGRVSRRGQRWAWPGIQAIRRWHFYAGLFCIPFVLLLSLTGLVYLFKPQIDDLIDRRFEQLAVPARPAHPADEVRAALATVPDSTLLAYELPRTPRSAARVIVVRHGEAIRVYVDPGSLAILKTVPEEWRFERIVFNLHGQLLLGNAGSLFVELVASWAIVMILTGLCLWWPRPATGRTSRAGLLYPRLRAGRGLFWRDMHAVAGLWASMLVLFLLISGLPWAYGWGSYLQAVRSVAGATAAVPDWQVGHVPARVEIAGATARPDAATTQTMLNMPDMADMAGMGASAPNVAPGLEALDAVVSGVRPLNLAYPVLVTPPSPGSVSWAARSDAQDRRLRTTLLLSPNGRLVSRTEFGQRPLLDRVVGIGVSGHEGHLFGWPNVVLDAFAALSMILVGFSAIELWLRRRRPGRLGAPAGRLPDGVSKGFVALVVVMGLLLPMFGMSVILVVVLERTILRRIARVADWLGLDPPAGVRLS
jgi:uncharacterized iron-regulated membrane protein